MHRALWYYDLTTEDMYSRGNSQNLLKVEGQLKSRLMWKMCEPNAEKEKLSSVVFVLCSLKMNLSENILKALKMI